MHSFRPGQPLFPTMITSVRNPKVQWVRSLQGQPKARREAGLFVVEGVRLVEEAWQAGWQPELVLYTEGLGERGRRLVEAFQRQGSYLELVSEPVMKAAGETENPQGLLAVLPLSPLPLPPSPSFLLILDGLRDPGNVGTILRTAGAAGVETVFLTPGSSDAFAPKVVRAAMGAHFRLPVHTLPWAEIEQYLQRGVGTPLSLYLADSEGGLPYSMADFRLPLALLLGGEAQGAGETARQAVQTRIHIPMPGQSESLNVAAAAAVLLFEVVRQRQP
jgi:RNA methyltransferase, TrmH family